MEKELDQRLSEVERKLEAMERREGGISAPPMDGHLRVFLLDASGSASVESLREAMRMHFAAMDTKDYFQVFAFDSEVQERLRTVWLHPTAGPIDEVDAWIHTLTPGGGSAVVPAMKEACKLLAECSRAASIVVVTDGHLYFGG